MSSLLKVGGTQGKGSFEVRDASGTPEIRLNGTKVASTQQAAIASLTNSTGGTTDGTLSDGLTVTAITDSTTGTADGTLADVTATYSQAILNNNFADVAAKLNTIVTDLTTSNNNVAELNAKVDAILTALRAYGVIASA